MTGLEKISTLILLDTIIVSGVCVFGDKKDHWGLDSSPGCSYVNLLI